MYTYIHTDIYIYVYIYVYTYIYVAYTHLTAKWSHSKPLPHARPKNKSHQGATQK